MNEREKEGTECLLKLTDSDEKEGGKKWNWRFEWMTSGRGAFGISPKMRTTKKIKNKRKKRHAHSL